MNKELENKPGSLERQIASADYRMRDAQMRLNYQLNRCKIAGKTESWFIDLYRGWYYKFLRKKYYLIKQLEQKQK